ncbi:alpha/beta hydrolase [Micromonospora sp. NPDC006431]|uniref:alpha/beta hydrolase n=1 Tax=Micromonospora sp. NPDC006431 TaxID=3364235 RepID=UPI003682C209
MEEMPGYLRPFVLSPAECRHERESNLDWYLPESDEPQPAVILVHGGPLPPELHATPRDWPVYRGYGNLLASRGLVAVTVEHRMRVVATAQGPATDCATAVLDVASAVERVRADPRVDPDRIALWFFSGGGLLSTDWLRERPAWLRGVALTYPVLAPMPGWGVDPRFEPSAAVTEPGTPVPPLLLTRVGLEADAVAGTVAVFLKAADDAGVPAEVIDVPNGHHAFDMLDHTDESRRAVEQAANWVSARLTR